MGSLDATRCFAAAERECVRVVSRGTDPGADPGAKPEEWARKSAFGEIRPGRRGDRGEPVPPSFLIPFGIGTYALNPSRRSREQADRKHHSIPGDGLPDRCNSGRLVLHLRRNQDISSFSDLVTCRCVAAKCSRA